MESPACNTEGEPKMEVKNMVRLKIGYVSTSQLSFPGDKQSAVHASVEGLKKLAQQWDFDLYVYEKTVITEQDALNAREVLQVEHVDLIMLQCTSFAAGLVVSTLARTKDARLGLWAIPEMRSSGVVSYNSLCGINMYSAIVSHYLKEYDIPTKWFYGTVDDAQFLRRFRITVTALRAIKKMQHANIALIGGIAPGFNDLYDDERKLLKLFDGMRINRLHEYGELKDLAMRLPQDEVDAKIAQLNAEACAKNEAIDHQIHTRGCADAEGKMSLMEVNARFALAYERFTEKYGYDALAISCWPKFQDDYLFSVCAVVGELNDKGVVAGCEGDLTSTVSMLLLSYLADDITMLMDMSAIDTNDDSVQMWHCGPASKRFCQKNGYQYSLNYSGKDHKGADLDHALGTGIVRDMVFDAGKATTARLTGEMDSMFVATGRFLDSGKDTYCGSRGWLGELELNREPISALDFFNTVMVRGFQHHFPIVMGDYSEELMEVMSWLKLRPVRKVKYENYLQREF